MIYFLRKLAEHSQDPLLLERSADQLNAHAESCGVLQVVVQHSVQELLSFIELLILSDSSDGNETRGILTNIPNHLIDANGKQVSRRGVVEGSSINIRHEDQIELIEQDFKLFPGIVDSGSQLKEIDIAHVIDVLDSIVKSLIFEFQNKYSQLSQYLRQFQQVEQLVPLWLVRLPLERFNEFLMSHTDVESNVNLIALERAWNIVKLSELVQFSECLSSNPHSPLGRLISREDLKPLIKYSDFQRLFLAVKILLVLLTSYVRVYLRVFELTLFPAHQLSEQHIHISKAFGQRPDHSFGHSRVVDPRTRYQICPSFILQSEVRRFYRHYLAEFTRHSQAAAHV